MRTLNKKQLCNLLHIGEETLKDIEKKKKLKDRLDKIGYKLLDRYKYGRNIYYDIESVNVSKEMFSHLAKNHYNTNKPKELGKYLKTREKASRDNIPISKKDLALQSGVCNKTISKWDITSLNENIMSEAGYCYFCFIVKDKKIIQVSQSEYTMFWRNKKYLKQLLDLQNQLGNGTISFSEFGEKTAHLVNKTQVDEGKFYFKIMNYKINTNNKLFKTLMGLISNIKLE